MEVAECDDTVAVVDCVCEGEEGVFATGDEGYGLRA